MDSLKDYGQDVELIKQFLRDYTHVDEDGEVQPKYKSILTKLANREEVSMFVELADLEQFNHTLAGQVTENTLRYVDLFYEALDSILPTYKTRDPSERDIMDVFIEQRLFISERNQRVNQAGEIETGPTQTVDSNRMGGQGRQFVDIDGKYPPDLIRRAEIYFKPSTFEAFPIREVKAELIGKLVTVRGIVTRATDVKPKITIATYTCDQCGCETFQPVTGIDYTPLFECTSATCKTMKTMGRITFQTRGSKFIKFQEIKLQEHSDQVPTGHIPRTITVMAHGELTRRCTPGDHISVSGVFLPIERSGFRFRTGGLTADTFIDAHYITKMNKTENDELNIEPLTEEEAKQLFEGTESLLDRLKNSIAPEIYGHDNLKKALLLLLVGGVDKNSFGMKIRGNINICLMGDPGTAKSQLLSFIDRLASRSQYTTGRGSSGVGLTAAVLKDPITNELVLEGGALVLADEGICCIDEFDKMMDSDRTAIHEVMEQQTVSIAKAGIMTTLNARVSILAAANPAYGRYNIHKTISDNLQLPPALLSRFDLLWLIRDLPEMQRDLNLAQHITQVHSNPNLVADHTTDCIDMKIMRRYISLCKRKQPTLPKPLSQKLKDIYKDIRRRKRVQLGGDSLFTSPRSLLAIIRLSTAFARLRLADEVSEDDVDAAVELYNCSRESIMGGIGAPVLQEMDILKVIRTLAKTLDSRVITVEELKEHCEKEGYPLKNPEQVLAKLQEYDFIDLDRSCNNITLVE